MGGAGGTGSRVYWTHNLPLLGVLPMLVNYNLLIISVRTNWDPLGLEYYTFYLRQFSMRFTMSFILHPNCRAL